QRSTCAFAFGARTGVRTIRMPSTAKRHRRPPRTCCRGRGEEVRRAVAIVEVDQQIACLLKHPGRVRIAGTGDVLDTATADREEDEHVQAAKPDGVNGQEVAGEIESPC